MKTRFTLYLLGLYLLCCTPVWSQKFPVDTLQKTGPLDNRINVVILGDGFTQNELPDFLDEARKFMNTFLKYHPYNHYQDYFNFFAIATPSAESGATNPGNAPDVYPDQPVVTRNTYYGASFGSNIHRLVTIQNYTAYINVLATNLPSYDLVVMIVNSTWYGGSGGSLAIYTLHEQALPIALHEIGHTFADLSDEYWAGSSYARENANMTRNSQPATVRWKNWMNYNKVGIFAHGTSGDMAQWYKPTSSNCLMEQLHSPFCEVCRETTVERIATLVRPIEAKTPSVDTVLLAQEPVTFGMQLLKPTPNSLQVEWKFNNKPLNTNQEQLILTADQLPEAQGTLSVTVFDSTYLSRVDLRQQQRSYTVSWWVETASAGPIAIATDTLLCAGDSTTLTARGCTGTLSWSTGESSSTITVVPTQTTSYWFVCNPDDQSIESTPATVWVVPLPEATASHTGPYLEGQTIQLHASGGETYRWFGPMFFHSFDQNPTIPNATASHAGLYAVTVTDANGCSNMAHTELTVEPVLASEPLHSQAIRVFPNPAMNYVDVTTTLPGEAQMTLYDTRGTLVLSRTFSQSTQLPLHTLTPGLYFYKVVQAGHESAGKLLVAQ